MEPTINRLSVLALKTPKLLITLLVFLVSSFTLLAVLPTFWPQTFSKLHSLKVDTDPENMLHHQEPVRLFHDQMKKELGLHDMVVVGIVNEKDPDGVFNPESLKRIFDLTQYIKTLQWPDPQHPEQQQGVVEVDLIAPSTVDNIKQAGLGTVRFEWLMDKPPQTREEARQIKDQAAQIPFLNGTLLSEDGKALCLYIPLTSKDVSYKIYSRLKEKIATFKGEEQYHITGLPVAEDTFGVEMFIQMAISAPAAMLVIFILMFFFFRKLVLIISPLIVALCSVLFTMSLLVITGNTVHIMSSMIPIFIMPIAVLDSVHILSEFYDSYPKTQDRYKTITHVMRTLFTPMLYTSLTSMAGFASLALTPIPPVQVFGIFVAIGIFFAWLLTMTFIPAYVMLIPEKFLSRLGNTSKEQSSSKILSWLGRFSFQHARSILIGTALLSVVIIYGIFHIQINDNPTRWFRSSHPIRQADRILNEHFGGTYMAYLMLEKEPLPLNQVKERFFQEATSLPKDVLEPLKEKWNQAPGITAKEKLNVLENFVSDQLWETPKDQLPAWEKAEKLIADFQSRQEIFKNPEALRYLNQLQEALQKTEVVGKSNSLSDIIKTVHRELFEGKKEAFRIPDSSDAVAQCLITYQSSHRPQDLWHFVTPDYRKSSLWVQLKSGDNKEMTQVVKAANRFIKDNPPPFGLQPQWFGLTYINVIWQEKMVSGMLQAFAGSFLVVFLLMTLLFRSPLWGILCMIPLTLTIGLIYGIIGLIGKDYDMPIAVLSSLTLGLAVDFAIHFLARARSLYLEQGTWVGIIEPLFGEPARAIYRNIIVIAGGFLPLLLAPLVPYNTVGIFLACILLISGFATLILLPGLISLLKRFLVPETAPLQFLCRCSYCFISFALIIGIVAINLHQFFKLGATPLTLYSLLAVITLGLVCFLSSRRAQCDSQNKEPLK